MGSVKAEQRLLTNCVRLFNDKPNKKTFLFYRCCFWRNFGNEKKKQKKPLEISVKSRYFHNNKPQYRMMMNQVLVECYFFQKTEIIIA